MKPEQMVLRCYAERRHNLWSAVCLDLCLAAQADTLEEAKAKLHEQVLEYFQDAYDQDEQHFDALMNRKAPRAMWAKYHAFKLLRKLKSTPSRPGLIGELFKERLPFRPAF